MRADLRLCVRIDDLTNLLILEKLTLQTYRIQHFYMSKFHPLLLSISIVHNRLREHIFLYLLSIKKLMIFQSLVRSIFQFLIVHLKYRIWHPIIEGPLPLLVDVDAGAPKNT